MVVLMLVAGSLFIAFVFSYLYLWTVSPQVWAPTGSVALPSLRWPIVSGLLLVISICSFVGAAYTLPHPGKRNIMMPSLLILGAACLAGGVVIETVGHWQSGLRPTDNSYSAMVYMAAVLTGQIAAAVVVMALYTLARFAAGKLDAERRVTFDNAALLACYAAVQGLVGLLLVHGFPRVIG
jgi:cytochrome c oxidase subunit I+III